MDHFVNGCQTDILVRMAVTANDAWVVLRIYGPAPDPALSGHTLSGGTPLPAVSFDETTPLAACPPPSPADGQGLSLIPISEPTRLRPISYAVFFLKKKKNNTHVTHNTSVRMNSFARKKNTINDTIS